MHPFAYQILFNIYHYMPKISCLQQQIVIITIFYQLQRYDFFYKLSENKY